MQPIDYFRHQARIEQRLTGRVSVYTLNQIRALGHDPLQIEAEVKETQ